MTGPWAARFRIFEELLAKHHPVGLRHEHLAILAVDPDHQRQGIGTALLATHHRRLDQGADPAATYLEASDPATRQLYLTCGYTDHGEPIHLPDGPVMFPMLRQAAPAPTLNASGQGAGL
ncbi:GNAT family N-acetyltransferase [Catenulispora yoronensis]